MGGTVALELQKQLDNIHGTRTFGAPVYTSDFESKENDRYRNEGDPVSMFDKAAHTYTKYSKPFAPAYNHSYKQIASEFPYRETDNPEKHMAPTNG